jgi:hypothetical protein
MYVERELTDEQIARLKRLADQSPPSEDHSGAGAIIIGVPIVVGLVANLFGSQIASLLFRLLLSLRAHISQVPFQFLFLLTILILAMLLYALRSRMRRVYGALEVTCGCVASLVAANRIYESMDDLSNVLATLAGLYIIIRGFDNWNHNSSIPIVLTAPSKATTQNS